jgi:hypothetical protein
MKRANDKRAGSCGNQSKFPRGGGGRRNSRTRVAGFWDRYEGCGRRFPRFFPLLRVSYQCTARTTARYIDQNSRSVGRRERAVKHTAGRVHGNSWTRVAVFFFLLIFYHYCLIFRAAIITFKIGLKHHRLNPLIGQLRASWSRCSRDNRRNCDTLYNNWEKNDYTKGIHKWKLSSLLYRIEGLMGQIYTEN